MAPMRKGKRFPMTRCSSSISNIMLCVVPGTVGSDHISPSLLIPECYRVIGKLFFMTPKDTPHPSFSQQPAFEDSNVETAVLYLTQRKKYTPLAPTATMYSPSG